MLKRFHLVFDIALNSFVSNIALVHLFYSLSYFLVLFIYLFIYLFIVCVYQIIL